VADVVFVAAVSAADADFAVDVDFAGALFVADVASAGAGTVAGASTDTGATANAAFVVGVFAGRGASTAMFRTRPTATTVAAAPG
jgi:microcystin degradation protein MlrC